MYNQNTNKIADLGVFSLVLLGSWWRGNVELGKVLRRCPFFVSKIGELSWQIGFSTITDLLIFQTNLNRTAV